MLQGLAHHETRQQPMSRLHPTSDECSAVAVVWGLCLFLLFFATASTAAPSAGTVIENRAYMTYVDAASGLSSRLVSNAVLVIVQPQPALVMEADRILQRTPGSLAVFPHRLSNTGNASAQVTFAVSGTMSTRIIVDANSNGVADSGEVVLDASAGLPLAAGSSVDLLLEADIPADASPGSRFTLQFTAMVVGVTGVQATNTDTVEIVSGPTLHVTKSALTPSAVPGGEAIFRITGTNSGNVAAQGLPLLVDGVTRSLLIISDMLPANTRLTRVSGSHGEVLYHQRGEAANSWHASMPINADNIDAVAWALDRLEAMQTVIFDIYLQVTGNATGTVENLAVARYDDGSGNVHETRSNTARISLPERAPILNFYHDAAFGSVAEAASMGDTLYLQADAAACNRDPQVAEQVTLTLISTLTGDTETFIVGETAPNSGMFRILSGVQTADMAIATPVSGDSMLSLHSDDQLTASLAGCGATMTQTMVLIDPYGVVFDSKTNAPVAGARVSLIDVTGAGNGGNPGAAAKVFATDGVTPAPSTVVTDTDGRYFFPLVAPSEYRLVVVPPGSFTFPSDLPPALQPAGRVIDQAASYGQSFPVNAATGAVQADIPLDLASTGGLFLRKRAARDRVEIGDFVDYTVEIKNVSGSPVAGITLTDTLPSGFAYVRGSTRRDGRMLSDPSGGLGPRLSFAIGILPANATTTLTYRLRVTAMAREGAATNQAQAGSAAPLPLTSNLATATVKVEGGIFSSRGFVLGRVFLDCDGNGLPGQDEPGAAGVRVVLETGDTATTDAAGQFHFDNLRPVTHVVKLDAASLPAGAIPQATDSRHMGDGASRFVDLKNGELLRADFALQAATGCGSDASPATTVNTANTLASMPAPVSLEEMASAEPNRHGESPPRMMQQQSAMPVSLSPNSLPLAGERDDGSLREFHVKAAFLLPADGAVLAAAQTPVRLAAPLGSRIELRVNGSLLPSSRIGARVEDAGRGILAVEYVGVDLQPGANRLELAVFDTFGNQREQRAITVTVPGALARIEIAATATPVADGRGVTPVSLRLLDANGVPVAARTPLTLETAAGIWKTADLDSVAPGVQVFVEGGEATFPLTNPSVPTTIKVRANSGSITAESAIAFAPYLRPLLAVGVVDGILDLRRLKGLQQASPTDSFERELRSFGDDALRGRTALFLKGKVRGDMLLTLAYDSDKPARQELFRDIQPDRYYPVYGDESSRGFEANSSDKLYVRVDKGSSYALYGDFTTTSSAASPATNAAQLARYSRSLTGVKAHHEAGSLKTEAFASQGRSRLVVEELAGIGISGPYRLKATDIVSGSEKVELLVRDRNQPAVILSATPQTAFVDYDLDSGSGRLLFRRPVPSLDADFNPVSIRVTYESDQGGADFWVVGGDAELKLSDTVTVGASIADDRNPQSPYQLGGVRARWQPSANTKINAEVAQSHGEARGSGQAGRIQLTHKDGPLALEASIGRADESFDNPAAPLTHGREEATARASYTINRETRLAAEAIRSGNANSSDANGGVRDGIKLGLEHDLGDGWRLEAGLRSVNETVQPAQPGSPGGIRFTSARAKLAAPVPGLPEASVYAEAEQAVIGNGRLLAMGGEYRFGAKSRLYARHEFLNSLTGLYGLNDGQRQQATVVGLDSQVMEGGQLFSEYRGSNAFDGRAAEAAIGLRNLWSVSDGVRLSTSVERVAGIGKASRNEALALTGAVEWTVRPDLKTTARLEWRDAQASNSWLATAGVAWKLDRSWSLLGKVSLDTTRSSNGGDTLRERLQAGVAYRDLGGRWYGLARYARLLDETPSSRHGAHLVSTHANLQPQRGTEWTFRYAAKWAQEDGGGLTSRGTAQMFSARWIRELGNKWDMGLGSNLAIDGGFAHRRLGVQAELGYQLATNLWLSAGYSWIALKDQDLAGDQPTNAGAFLRLRFKFDEKTLKGVLPE